MAVNLSAGLRLATIPKEETTSSVVDLEGYRYVALILPQAFSGTKLTVEVAATRYGPFVELNDEEGNPVEIAVAQDAAVSLGKLLAPFRYVRFVSDAGGGEEADRALTLVLKA